MTDREERLMRSLIRMAVADRLLDAAANDAWPVLPDLAVTIDRRAASIRRLAARVRRELDWAGATGRDRP